MNRYEVEREISAVLDKILEFNHPGDDWEKDEVEFGVKVLYVVNEDNNKIGLTIKIKEED